MLLTSAASAAELTGTLKRIQHSGTMTLGYREASVPFSYLQADGTPTGYGFEVCKAVSEAVKKELNMPNLTIKYQAVTSANRIPLIQNGTVDIECGSTTNSKARQREAGFGINYFGVRYLMTKDFAESMQLVAKKRAAAFVIDDVLLAGQISNLPNPQDFKIVDASLSVEPYAPMFAKDDPAFKALVDKTIVGMMKDGTLDKLYKKWFESPIPPKNANLNFPMNSVTKELFANPNSDGI